ncbi:FecCD family ABC transporter permease [Marinospirillum perlucidum]|uniref:FecCD family ABC transporter permease n=1 Tax=Marinospirillum perlucidum TaxID=1982602 RepID=UPI000DF2C2F9|nr:iron ABC transporter permease [Marinospirillum perlucidum]
MEASLNPPAEQQTLAAAYRQSVRGRRLLLLLLILAVIASFLVDLTLGASNLGLMDLLIGLGSPASLTPGEKVILWDMRLPFAVMALLVGAALGWAGSEIQTALNNPLASPFTLGISGAATLGAATALVLDWGFTGLAQTTLIPLFAFVFALGCSLVIQLVARRFDASIEMLVLFGIALFFTMNALVALLQFYADADTVQQIVFWTLGSVTRANWDKITLIAVLMGLCLPFSIRSLWAMTALRAGELQARSLGIDIKRLRLGVLLRVSLLTAVAVAFVGEIGFVGLVGPHIARLLLGEDHRFYIPGSALAGALIMSLASILSKSLIPGVILPLGIVTALVGIPLFMALILRRQKLL